MVREAGLEPARPEWTLEPESSESANSTTRAYAFFERSNNIAHGSRVVNPFFWKFRPCLQARPVCAMRKPTGCGTQWPGTVFLEIPMKNSGDG